jgi:hypothetical protein
MPSQYMRSLLAASTRTPLIYGEVQGQAQLAPSTRLRVVALPDSSPCEGNHSVEATTDAKGAFLLCPDPDFQWLVRVMAHRTFDWNVCILRDNVWTLVHTGSEYTLADTGPRGFVELNCVIENGGGTCDESLGDELTPALPSLLEQHPCERVSPTA